MYLKSEKLRTKAVWYWSGSLLQVLEVHVLLDVYLHHLEHPCIHFLPLWQHLLEWRDKHKNSSFLTFTWKHWSLRGCLQHCLVRIIDISCLLLRLYVRDQLFRSRSLRKIRWTGMREWSRHRVSDWLFLWRVEWRTSCSNRSWVRCKLCRKHWM